MARHILRCNECGKYTLKEECLCGGKTVRHIPPKYSPEDQYGEYRRRGKREMREKEGII